MGFFSQVSLFVSFLAPGMITGEIDKKQGVSIQKVWGKIQSADSHKSCTGLEVIFILSSGFLKTHLLNQAKRYG